MVWKYLEYLSNNRLLDPVHNSNLVGLKNNLKKNYKSSKCQKIIVLCSHILGFENHYSFSWYISLKVGGVGEDSIEKQVAQSSTSLIWTR